MCEDESFDVDRTPELEAATPDLRDDPGPIGRLWFARQLSRRRLLQAALATAGGAAVSPFLNALAPRPAFAETGWRFYRTDPHVHCVVSGDAVADPGVLAAAATASGKNPYDVIFLTDHHLGSKFAISGQSAVSGSWAGALNGGTEDVQDSTSKWSAAKYGTLSTYVARTSTTHVHTVSPALYLKAQSPSYGEAMAWYKRGPNLLSAGPTITFWVYPTQVDPGCSVYVSASLGGDPTTPYKADGYTTKADHIARPGKSHVFIWQLGTTTVPLGYPAGTTIHQSALGAFVLNQWNAFTINVNDYLATVTGTTDAPIDLNALVHLKMAVSSSSNGIAEAYFDDWSHTATPVPTPQEFSARNVELPYYNTNGFQIVPSIELGLHEHVQRFNFADSSQWKDYYSGVGLGTSANGILDVQATGYPAQLNHPGLPGGPAKQATIDNNAYGADIMEAGARAGDGVMIDIWDAILSKGMPLIGSWSSDAHRVATLDPCTYIHSPSTAFDDLMHSFFEGRAFMANRSFSGQVAVNLAAGDQDSYPARYPVFVPGASMTATAHVLISAGVTAGSAVRWIVNGAVSSSQATNGPSYERSYAVPLATSGKTYARAELLDSAGSRVAMTQAMFFFAVADLPVGNQFHVSRVTSTQGPIFTKAVTKGIAAVSYDLPTATLALTLANPSGALVEMDMTAPDAPSSVVVDGTPIAVSGTLSDYQAATGTAWYRSGASVLLKILHSSASAAVQVMYIGSSGDTSPPTVPSGVAAVQATSGAVNVTWSASTDNVGVVGYTIYRDGAVLDTVEANTLRYADTTTAPSTSYSYTIDAVDEVGNHSAASTAGTVTTRGNDVATTLTAVADAYVQSSSPTGKFGSATTLKVDADGIMQSYLRFVVPPTGGSVVSATLRLFPITSQTPGCDVYPVSDDTWTEAGITWATAPGMSNTKIGSSGKVTASTWISVDVAALISDGMLSGGGHINIGLATSGTTALSLSSREGVNPPRLVLTTTPPPPDSTPPGTPSGVTAAQDVSGSVQIAWNASQDDVAVTGYTVYRSGVALATVGGATLNYADSGTTPGTTYSYAIDAFDAAGNHSTPSPAVSLTTRSNAVTTTLVPVADAYIQSTNPSINFGTATTLKVDADGILRSYLRFALPATAGSLISATLRIYANSSQSPGYDVYGINDHTWNETAITWQNAPSIPTTKTGSSGKVTAATWTAVDVTSLVSTALINAGGNIDLALATTGTTALSMSSREGLNPPQLVIVTA
jgi:chitodextrinase